jgi:hypothetical protein
MYIIFAEFCISHGMDTASVVNSADKGASKLRIADYSQYFDFHFRQQRDCPWVTFLSSFLGLWFISVVAIFSRELKNQNLLSRLRRQHPSRTHDNKRSRSLYTVKRGLGRQRQTRKALVSLKFVSEGYMLWCVNLDKETPRKHRYIYTSLRQAFLKCCFQTRLTYIREGMAKFPSSAFHYTE